MQQSDLCLCCVAEGGSGIYRGSESRLTDGQTVRLQTGESWPGTGGRL